MRIKDMISIAAACALVEPAFAHDFWLEADAFHVESGMQVEIDFVVGHDYERASWSLRKERIVSFLDHAPGGFSDRAASIRYDNKDRPGAASLSFAENGTHVLAFESRPSAIELPAARFNDYIAKEGLTLAIEAREKNKQASAPGRERYSRRAKLLTQIGDRPTDNVVNPVGHTLEIVPEKNPYALDEDEALPVRVLFHGKPLAGALVDLESLSVGVLPIVTKITDDRGRAEFSLPKTGAWKLNVIWTTPRADNDGAEFDTIFASLTFGYNEREND